MKTSPPKIKYQQRGRGGSVYYEEASQLMFGTEIMSQPGMVIYVPSPERWDSFCVDHGATWAVGRRSEILERLGSVMLRKVYGRGTFSVEEHWVDLIMAPSRLTQFLDFLTRHIVRMV